MLLALLGCTAGTMICFILPSVIYLRCLDAQQEAKVSQHTLAQWQWARVLGGRRLDRVVAYTMLWGGVLLSLASLIATLALWNDIQ